MFIDITVNIEGFTFELLYAMIFTVIIKSFISAVRLYEFSKNGEPIYLKKSYSVISVISVIIQVLFFVAGLIFAVFSSTAESASQYFPYLQNSLFIASFFILVPFLAIFFPLFKKTARQF